ncbi:MAG TPA: hypothetical protein VH137_04435, partial [Gemmatimonadales bacterium]|nr:hypothetical protein [Gemmatimonadales bacterium]
MTFDTRSARQSALGAASACAWPLAGAIAAAIPALWMWGFTVDDALIAVRYAHHIATGSGWRFNAHGPATDGVTPLPWPLLLAPFARADAIMVLTRAKTLGLLVWSLTGAVLGGAIGRAPHAPVWARGTALGVMALSVPVAAHAVSGMETALATALATWASLVGRRPRVTSVLAGLAASLRPEMAPWACVLAMGSSIASRSNVARTIANGAIALTPFVACAAVRAIVWGRPAPLAILAKPSDVAHGLAYAGAACVVTLVPLLVLAPIALRREPSALAIVIAAGAHACAIIVVGGDWMPYARLMVPVVPSLVYVAARVSVRAHPAATVVRGAVATALGVALIARGGTAGRRVGPDRRALIAAARPLLQGAGRVASLDVGWVGAATEAEIIDLAGLTDPEIAVLP